MSRAKKKFDTSRYRLDIPHVRITAKRPKAGPQRTEIRMPWEGKGGGYRILSEAIGATRRGQVKYDRGRGVFTVSRKHNKRLVKALTRVYGEVLVIQRGGLAERCTSACWDAAFSTSWSSFDCECACLGEYHAWMKRPPHMRTVTKSPSILDGGDMEVAIAARPDDEPYVFLIDATGRRTDLAGFAGPAEYRAAVWSAEEATP